MPIIYLFFILSLFSNSLKEVLTIFNYLDELLVVLCVGIYLLVRLMMFSYRQSLTVSFIDKIIFFLMLLYGLWCFLPNMFTENAASLPLQLFSLFGMLKFILFYLAAKPIILAEDLFQKRRLIKGVAYGYTTICYVIYGLNLFGHFLPTFGLRFGLNTYAFGYEHPAQFSIALIMMTILVAYINFLQCSRPPFGLLFSNLVLIIIAGRITAISFYILMMALLLIIPYVKRIPTSVYLTISSVVFIFARERIIHQFIGSNGEARGVLIRTSFKIAKDYFPFGGGLGRFGSQASREVYSQLYYKYHISHYWGMSPKASMFLTDSYWAMVIGETGWIGMGLMMLLITLIGLSISKSVMSGRTVYVLLPLMYALLTSPIDTVFVSNGIILVIFTTLLLLNFNYYGERSVFSEEKNKKMVNKITDVGTSKARKSV